MMKIILFLFCGAKAEDEASAKKEQKTNIDNIQ